MFVCRKSAINDNVGSSVSFGGGVDFGERPCDSIRLIDSGDIDVTVYNMSMLKRGDQKVISVIAKR